MCLCVDMDMRMNYCFMYVQMCTYCVCMHVRTMYSAVRIPLVSNNPI